ncbi:MAG: hypothetical protein M3362_27575, partial [Acidobacteriota bacterium]|nr:hypothetical protein [Acidobacteriota bacterium]
KNTHLKLAFQPLADQLRRRLGRRFSAQGLERSVWAGILTVGAERTALRMVRTQNADGEQVEIALAGRAPLTWTALEGVKSAGNAASQG